MSTTKLSVTATPGRLYSFAEPATADLATTLEGVTAAFTGDHGVTATLTATLTGVTAAFTGSYGVAGDIASTLEDVSAALVGSFGEDSDPNFAGVSLLLHMDGADGSTTFTDSSSNAVTVTAVGNAQIDTAQSKFGGASGLFDGTGDMLLLPNNALYSYGAGDFTIECFIRPTSVAAGKPIYGQGSYNLSSGFLLYYAAGGALGWFTGNSAAVTGGLVSAGVWQHVAATRSSNTLRLFLDGALVGSAAVGNTYNSTPQNNLGGDYYNNTYTANGYTGHIDELRITKGFARYTSAFTPPTAAFPDSGISSPSGNLVATLTGATAAFTGDHGTTGDITATLTGVTAAFTGTHGVTGDLTATLDAATAAFTGTVGATTLQSTLGDATAVFTGDHGIAADLGTVLTGVTGAFAGTHIPAVAGDLATTLEGATAAFTGETADAPAGDFSITLEDVGVSLQGSYGVTGDLTASVDGALAAFAGTHVQPITGDLATTLAGATAAFTGEHPAQVSGALQTTLDDTVAALVGVHGVRGDIASTLDDAVILLSDKQPSIGFAPYPGVISVTAQMGAISITPRTGYIPFTNRAGVTVFSG